MLVAEKLARTELLSFVYEEWCAQMLKHTRMNTWSIHGAIRARFSECAFKVSREQKIPQHVIDQLRQEKKDAKLITLVQLGIDFGRLARIAANSKLHEVANYLISFEQKLENKIPFFYERQNYTEALR